MKLQTSDIPRLLAFFTSVGREAESAEAWAHALFDIQESLGKIYEVLLPEAVSEPRDAKKAQVTFWDIRDELRHVEYHLKDIENR